MSPSANNGDETSTISRNSSQTRQTEDDGETKRPPKKRKQRQLLSCAECRRLKLKCDRQVPCANCVKRSCGHLCPDGERPQGHSASNGLISRLETLEGVLQQHGIPFPAANTSSSSSSRLVTVSNDHVNAIDKDQASSPPPQRSAQIGQPQPQSADTEIFEQISGSRSDRDTTGDALSELADAAALTQHDSAPNYQADLDIGPILPEPELHRVRFDFSTPTVESLNIHRSMEILPQHASPDSQSYGTLVLSHGGRSKYLGPTAASEWLKDQEIHDPVESPSASRYASPERAVNAGSGHSTAGTVPVLFPFRSQHLSSDELLARLPPLEEASVLVECYFRYFAWHFDVVPRQSFKPIFDRIYSAVMSSQQQRVVSQELALLYIILALGALHSLELRPNDPSAENYCNLSKACLAKGDFLVHTTLAGVQTLHIMGHYMLETEKGRNGDSAWPLWGMAMRLSQAMGLHRDGARWNLPAEVVEQIRRVFWECFSVEIFQANCFSRPCSLSPEYVDAAFPANTGPVFEKDFYHLKFELSQISAAILERAMKVKSSPYSTVTDLHQRLCEFERGIPFRLRCRAALLALPSVYSTPELAMNDSPAPTQSNLILSFQQCTLAINISETVLFLHRPFYARALNEAEDPTRSTFGLSFLAVVERCHVTISVVASLYEMHPNVCARHWYLWYHAFNSAVCLGTLILRDPKNALSAFAISQIDATIKLYTPLVQVGSSKRILNNLRWLLRLRAQAGRKIEKSTSGMPSETHQETGEDSEDENIELIGLKTRLIERASRGSQVSKTIFQTTPSASGLTEDSPTTHVHDTISKAVQDLLFNTGAPGQNIPAVSNVIADSTDLSDTSTNDLLHQFWDPMMLQDVTGNDGLAFADNNWWNWNTDVNAVENDTGHS
ncbi:uncharacterized protein L201_003795 [Kwoniella dendrophila CBS 6074]|uniref:Zn(2)-C6 fungal-type domain-containing protein n=1 Tax=Kwoniella dendrophila CBS 6074 TaxID=1295534 RepID=A0AAX4JWF6_9TREE